MNVFGERLRQVRKAAGETQWQLAEALFVGKKTVGMWETAGCEPSYDTLAAICKRYGKTADWMIGREKNT